MQQQDRWQRQQQQRQQQENDDNHRPQPQVLPWALQECSKLSYGQQQAAKIVGAEALEQGGQTLIQQKSVMSWATSVETNEKICKNSDSFQLAER
jgi:hypothetical protein